VDEPTVENQKLKEIIDSMWASGKDVIGDGSIMDAIRYERKNNVPVKGRTHSKKGRDTIARLEKWLGSKTSPKPKSDNKVARMLIKEIRDALNS
jgi:hypothetical protein